MYKVDLVLNNLQWSVYHKTRPYETKITKSSKNSDDPL